MNKTQIGVLAAGTIFLLVFAFTFPVALFTFWVGAFAENGKAGNLTLFPRLKNWFDSLNPKPPQGPISV